MSEPFVAEIRIFGFNFAPKGWALCQGQLQPISQNTALFSLLGVSFGGDGRTTFGLPNLQAVVPLGTGNGPGLTPRVIGEQSGTPSVTLLISELPAHTHNAIAAGETGNDYGPANDVWAPDAGGANEYGAASPVALNPQSIALVGGFQPHNNMQPYVAMNYCIALQGIFPSRG